MAKKKKSRKKKGFVKELKSGLDEGVVKGVWGISLTALAFLSVLSFFGQAGAFGDFLVDAFSIIFGWGMYLVPFMLLAIGAGIVLSWEDKSKTYFLVASILFLSAALGIFSISNFENAVERGGYWGFLFAWPLFNFLGVVGASVVLSSILVIAIIIGFNLPVDKVLKKILDKRKQKKLALEVPSKSKARAKDKRKEKPDKNEEKPKKEDLQVQDYHEAEKESREQKSSHKEKPEKKKHKEEEEEFAGQGVANQLAGFKLPDLSLLEQESGKPTSGDIVANANIIKRTLQNFGIDVEMGEVNVGPTVTQYTLKPAEGVKLSRITALSNDLGLALAAHPLRIEAPIPGRSLVGIEIPNHATTWVRLRDLLEHPKIKETKGSLILALGRDVKGNPVYADLAKMPHLLIAGSTGSGKTISINTILLSLLYNNSPQSLRLILVDPKRVELSAYSDIPHLLAPIVVENNKAVNALKWAVKEMERRFEILSEEKARDISSYNSRNNVQKEGRTLPYIVLAIDELADLMSAKGKEVEALIVRIAQMARAVGIHLILATQRPSVEVITGLIKANITSRIAFQVASQVDSRTVLDVAGAERLLGNGDMLYIAPNANKPRRVQGAFVKEDEVQKVTNYLRDQKDKFNEEESTEAEMQDFSTPVDSPTQSIDFDNTGEGSEEEDELYREAKNIAIKDRKASASYLQRRLRIGYARAARLVDMLEENGVVGPAEGAKPRDIYVSADEEGNSENDAENNTEDDGEES